MNKLYVLFACIAVLVFFSLGCSSSTHNPVTPQDSKPGSDTNSLSGTDQLLGLWNLSFDEKTLVFQIEPIRASQAHMNITEFLLPPICEDCLEINVINFDPITRIVEAEITLTNPYEITGYDVRGIVYTDEAGHRLLNDDAWTGYFDLPGGQIINPFIFFDKWYTDHSFPPLDVQAEIFEIYLPPLPHDPLQYAVTVSYPDNCDEPYSIENFQQDGILSPETGSQVTCTVDVRDWQTDVDKVTLHAPDITGIGYVTFTHDSGPTWTLDLTNSEGAPVGEYEVRITAYSTSSGTIELNKYGTIIISAGPVGSGWARTWGGPGSGIPGWFDEYAGGTDVDESGNIYIAGHFMHTVDFDPGPGTDFHTSVDDGDIFLTKLDMNGVHQWTRTWGSKENDQATGVVTDEDGNIFVTSSFDMMFTVLSKFDALGNNIWDRSWYGLSRGIAISPDSIFVAGVFGGTVDFDPGPGVDNKTSISSVDASISCFDKEGTYKWSYTWDGFNEYFFIGLSSDIYSNIYAVGVFNEEVDFDAGPGEDIHTSNGSWDIGLLKLSPTGEFEWALSWGGSDSDHSESVAIDNTGAIYVPGLFGGTCDFDPSDGTDMKTATGSSDCFLSKFDSSGEYLWSQTWGGTDMGSCQAISINDIGDVYISGSFYETFDFDPGNGTENHSSNGQSDIFLSRFDTSGNFIWARSWGGADDDASSAIVADNHGIAYVAGCFKDTVDFNPGSNFDYHTSNGFYDVFIIKVLPDGTW